MIGHEQESARRQIFQSDRLYPVNQPGKAAAKQIDRTLRSENIPTFVLRLQLLRLTLQSRYDERAKIHRHPCPDALLAINLFNYVDRYVLASVLPTLKHEFLAGDPNQNGKAGLWTTAFLISYMFTAPIFGWLADRFSRWILIRNECGALEFGQRLVGSGHLVWGSALHKDCSLGSEKRVTDRLRPRSVADLYPLKTRGRVLAWFYVAIPVGSALGYAYGGKIADLLSWRWAFYLVVPPGLLLAALCFFLRDPRATSEQKGPPPLRDYRGLFRIRSYVLNTAAMTVMTFAIGGFSRMDA